MSLDTTYIKQVTKYIEGQKDLVKDEGNKNYFDKISGYVENAIEAMADNEEKHAMLEDAVTRWANQLSFILFREGTLTKEAEEEFRSFKPVDETTAKTKEFQDARQAEIDDINAKHAEIIKRQKGIDIFQAIIGGMTKEQAKEKLEEYEAKLEEAQQQVSRG